MNFSRCRAYQKITDILILRKLLFSESIRDIVKVHGTLVISKSKIEDRGQFCEHKHSRNISAHATSTQPESPAKPGECFCKRYEVYSSPL